MGWTVKIKKIIISKISTIQLLNLSMTTWWGTTIYNFAVRPDILLQQNGAVSHYALDSDTVWLYSIGSGLSGLLMLALSYRVDPSKQLLRTHLGCIGLASMLLPIFHLNTGQISFLIHMILAATAFVAMTSCVVLCNIHFYNGKTNKLLSMLIILAYFINLGSFLYDSPIIFRLPFDQILIVAIFGFWLQYNLRTIARNSAVDRTSVK